MSKPSNYLLIPGPVNVALPVTARKLTRTDKEHLADILHTNGFWYQGEHFFVSEENAKESIRQGVLVRELPENTVVVEDLMSKFSTS